MDPWPQRVEKAGEKMKYVMSLRFSVKIVAVSGWIFALAIVWFLSVADVRAEVRISGSIDAVTIDAKNAPLTEIIAALNSKLIARINWTPAITPAITGKYSGSLRRVLLRMLDGQNVILTSSGDQISIILLANTGKSAVPLPVANSVSPQVPANHASNNVPAPRDEPNTSGVQGWTGAFSVNLPSGKTSK